MKLTFYTEPPSPTEASINNEREAKTQTDIGNCQAYNIHVHHTRLLFLKNPVNNFFLLFKLTLMQ